MCQSLTPTHDREPAAVANRFASPTLTTVIIRGDTKPDQCRINGERFQVCTARAADAGAAPCLEPGWPGLDRPAVMPRRRWPPPRRSRGRALAQPPRASPAPAPPRRASATTAARPRGLCSRARPPRRPAGSRRSTRSATHAPLRRLRGLRPRAPPTGPLRRPAAACGRGGARRPRPRAGGRGARRAACAASASRRPLGGSPSRPGPRSRRSRRARAATRASTQACSARKHAGRGRWPRRLRTG
mmetsp:Transcript_16466/g.52124  ORF Transcript_16466/g.52124 Transcript_16466/m.52124 type:complete len:244 (+) Transcript_16466:30-761(+)